MGPEEARPRDGVAGRRDFLMAAGGVGAGLAVAALGAGGRDAERGGDAVPMRLLGKTGVKVSALGVGGHHLGDFSNVPEASALVHAAIDAGVTFFDNCWEYYNGRTED